MSRRTGKDLCLHTPAGLAQSVGDQIEGTGGSATAPFIDLVGLFNGPLAVGDGRSGWNSEGFDNPDKAQLSLALEIKALNEAESTFCLRRRIIADEDLVEWTAAGTSNKNWSRRVLNHALADAAQEEEAEV